MDHDGIAVANEGEQRLQLGAKCVFSRDFVCENPVEWNVL